MISLTHINIQLLFFFHYVKDSILYGLLSVFTLEIFVSTLEIFARYLSFLIVALSFIFQFRIAKLGGLSPCKSLQTYLFVSSLTWNVRYFSLF
jgi:hypothetical protein